MDAGTILSQYGLAGLIILVLAGVVVALYRDNQALQMKLQAAQQARVDDAKEVGEKVIVPLDLLSKTTDLIYRKLYSAKEGS